MLKPPSSIALCSLSCSRIKWRPQIALRSHPPNQPLLDCKRIAAFPHQSTIAHSVFAVMLANKLVSLPCYCPLLLPLLLHLPTFLLNPTRRAHTSGRLQPSNVTTRGRIRILLHKEVERMRSFSFGETSSQLLDACAMNVNA